MIKISALNTLRPTKKYAEKVAAVSSGTPSKKQQIYELENNPFSYLHIVKPHLHFNENEVKPNIHYPFARTYFKQMMDQNVIEKAPIECVYIYKQILPDGHFFEGIVAGVSFLNYLEGHIKKHENTLAAKEERLKEHIVSLGAVGEPVLIATSFENEIIDWIKENKLNKTLLFNFKGMDENTHQIFEITEQDKIKSLQKLCANIPKMYIADGHHRIAATSKYCMQLFTTQNIPQEKLNFMAFIVPQSQLRIKSFHRLVAKVSSLQLEKLLQESTLFENVKSESPVFPSKKGRIGMFCNNTWYEIKIKNVGAELLDVSFLDLHVFNTYFDILDSRTDARITYIRGDKPLQYLEDKVNSGEVNVAFTLFANSMQEIIDIAEENKTMPPKSTYIEPKLLSGLIIQRF